ncbi:hypothetical protein [uncultured Legionella sp.]|uniref:hypothetical protein n=1 Tax=uncultured Legionella sp. TaxID=210934 RepID=UPI0026399A96|nr:hypothetical protein [uncultured Legionella sp.]
MFKVIFSVSGTHRKIVMLLLLGLGLFGKSWANQYSCSGNDSEQIQSAIIAYIEKDSTGGSQGASISSIKCLSSYASVIVHYAQPNFDDQIGYLHNANGVWNVIGLATGFDGETISQIPEPLLQ